MYENEFIFIEKNNENCIVLRDLNFRYVIQRARDWTPTSGFLSSSFYYALRFKHEHDDYFCRDSEEIFNTIDEAYLCVYADIFERATSA